MSVAMDRNPPLKTLYGLAPGELEAVVSKVGLPKYRAQQLLGWIYQKNVLAWGEIKNLPKEALEELSKEASLAVLEPTEEKSCGGRIDEILV